MPRIAALLFCLALASSAFGREVAITIDDLPRGGDSDERSLEAVRAMTEKLLQPFAGERIPVTGFVNEGRNVDFGADGVRAVLELWLDAGAELGNHSYSHLNVNNVPLEQFTADIVRGEPIPEPRSQHAGGRCATSAIHSCSRAPRRRSRPACERSSTSTATWRPP
jgi:peptidoglycan/xylan/chitin deacetylase (PgdA/CDA1 family)